MRLKGKLLPVVEALHFHSLLHHLHLHLHDDVDDGVDGGDGDCCFRLKDMEESWVLSLLRWIGSPALPGR